MNEESNESPSKTLELIHVGPEELTQGAGLNLPMISRIQMRYQKDLYMSYVR